MQTESWTDERSNRSSSINRQRTIEQSLSLHIILQFLPWRNVDDEFDKLIPGINIYRTASGQNVISLMSP